MRKLTIAALLTFALALASVAPAFAGGGGNNNWNWDKGSINVWCSVDTGSTNIDINGDLVVPDGSHGDVILWLFGSKNGKTWDFAWQEKVIHVVKGQTTYAFTFGGALDFSKFSDFKVIGDGTESRVINADECGFRVPEAPATPLLLLGAFPAAGLIAIKATGARLPLPHLHRVA